MSLLETTGKLHKVSANGTKDECYLEIKASLKKLGLDSLRKA